MKFTLLVFALFALASATKWYELEDYQFENYVKEFRKRYQRDESAFRR